MKPGVGILEDFEVVVAIFSHSEDAKVLPRSSERLDDGFVRISSVWLERHRPEKFGAATFAQAVKSPQDFGEADFRWLVRGDDLAADAALLESHEAADVVVHLEVVLDSDSLAKQLDKFSSEADAAAVDRLIIVQEVRQGDDGVRVLPPGAVKLKLLLPNKDQVGVRLQNSKLIGHCVMEVQPGRVMTPKRWRQDPVECRV